MALLGARLQLVFVAQSHKASLQQQRMFADAEQRNCFAAAAPGGAASAPSGGAAAYWCCCCS
jgi:hypothetical protein